MNAAPCCSGREKKIIDDEKDRMWEAQQEILRARREGRGMDGVSERRAAAKAQVHLFCVCTPSVSVCALAVRAQFPAVSFSGQSITRIYLPEFGQSIGRV